MAGTAAAKRKAEESRLRSRPNKKFKKQTHYSSGSSDSENGDRPSTIGKRRQPMKSKGNIAAKVSSQRDPRKIPPKAKQDGPSTLPDAPPSGDDEENEEDEEATADDSANSSSAVSDSDADSHSDTDSQSEAGGSRKRTKTKRSDPAAFASSISAILGSKLSSSSRNDPVLSRSATAQQTSNSLAEAKLEAKARRRLRDERRALQDRGRVRDVLLGDNRRRRTPTPGVSESEAEPAAGSKDAKTKQKAEQNGTDAASGGREARDRSGMSAAEIAEQERRLRKTAQRGVVKLFNAVRAAQVKGEEAAKEQKRSGVVGVGRREEKVEEMGRQAFLDLVGAGKIEEA